jgi:peptide/nickel transport system permease protein
MSTQREYALSAAGTHPPLSVRLNRYAAVTQRVLSKNPNMLGGLIVLSVMVSIALVAGFIDKIDPYALDPFTRLQSMSAEHWFGTDNVGRDVYSRTVHGGRISLAVGALVAVAVSLVGTGTGLTVGYFRRVDEVVMRFMDGVMAFPSLLLALALIAALGASFINIIIVISVVDTPRMVRVVRGSVLSVREMDFVTAAGALGAKAPRIMALHILPNILAPVIIQATFVFASAMLTEAALSFLGAGINPETPTWGNMIGQGRTFFQRAIWIMIFPGVFLSMTVLSINLVGDGLRDALDPKLRRRE